MTYDVSTLAEIMLLTCAIVPMGRLQALTYPKAQGIWCFEKKHLRGYSDEPALLHPGVWHLSFRRSSQHLYVICVYEIELDMFKFYDITLPSGKLT